jgi:hypothetical protein
MFTSDRVALLAFTYPLALAEEPLSLHCSTLQH